MDPSERTRAMLDGARRRAMEHEKASRANQGNSQFPLKQKLKVALPLAAIAATLYGCSFLYKGWLPKEDNEDIVDVDKQPDTITTIYTPTNHSRDDEILSDDNKKW